MLIFELVFVYKIQYLNLKKDLFKDFLEYHILSSLY